MPKPARTVQHAVDIRRVSGRGTDRDAACGDVIMNDDQAKKIKTDDSGASLIFFIYD